MSEVFPMRVAHLVIALSLATTGARALTAQRIHHSLYRPWTPPPLVGAVDRAPAPDYRWEGMKVGGFFGLAFGAYFGHGMCQLSDNAHKHCTLATIGGALITGVVGAGMGGLLGGMIPKAPPDSTTSP